MDAVAETSHAPGDLYLRWQALLADQPNLRIRRAADLLGVSELTLVQLRGPEQRTPLRREFGRILQAMKSVGPVMILARNDDMVHEVTAAFGEVTVSSSGAMGLAVGDIDVRVFLSQWAHGYHVTEEVRSGTRQSLQFFDRYGVAIQKIYRVDDTDASAWQSLVAEFTATGAEPFAECGRRAGLSRTDASDIDATALRKDWAALKDVHHFGAMLKRQGTDRLTALAVVGEEWARRLNNTTADIASPLDRLLEQVSVSQCPVMFFVGNPGIVQIFTGAVNTIRRTGPWMNVLDPGFSLHANTEGVAEWWVVRKPTVDGTVTSLEAFNDAGEIVLTLFGRRKPGQPESEDWRAEIAALEAELCG